MEPAVHDPARVAHHASNAPTAEPPSSVPDGFQVAAVASLAGLRDSCGNVPLDACVLVRKTWVVPASVSPRAAAVLLQVDGVLSLQEIAAKSNLSLPDTIGAYLDLLGLGIVDAAPATSPPSLPAPPSLPSPASLGAPASLASLADSDSPANDTVSDGNDTRISDIIGDLARLSDATSVPRLRGAVEWTDLAPSEAWLVSVVREGMPLAGIMQTSPLGEEETLRLLARLISARVITLPA